MAVGKQRIVESIIDVDFKLHKFEGKETQSGNSLYQFGLSLPEWLPESLMFNDGSVALAVVYYVTA